MKIAIVGAEESKWTEEQKEKAKMFIRNILSRQAPGFGVPTVYRDPSPTVLVSGHCPKKGVDIWAEDIATELGIEQEIYAPEVFKWQDKVLVATKKKLKGYRSRNKDIAKACDILYDIEPKGSCRYCNGRGYKNFTHVRPEGRKSIIRVMCRRCNATGNYSGATWTMQYAKKLGKEVHQVVIE